MQRRNFSGRRSESILLYGFGLALTLSLAFNAFLLHEQSRHQSIIYEYGLGKSDQSVDATIWQQQLSDCAQANMQKDSLIHWLERPPGASASLPTIIQRTNSR